MAPIAKLFVEIGSNITGFQRGMKQVDTQIKDTSKSANVLTTALGTGLGMVAVQATTKLLDLGRSAIDAGIGFNSLVENSTLAFETMLGSATDAKDLLEDLKQFAATTPFELKGLIPMAQKLKAFGFETQAIIPMLTNIGDAAAGLGGSPELLNRITIALGQIKAKGRVQAQEMMQLTEAGIPAWEILAKKIGVTIPEAMKLSEKGMIDSATAIEGILGGLGERFGGLMEKQSKSFTGLSSNLKDLFTQRSGELMKPWFDKIKQGMGDLLAFMGTERFKNLFAGLVKGSEWAANAIGKVASTVKGLFGFGGANGISNLFKVLDKYKNIRFAFLSNFTLDDVRNSINGFMNDLKHGGKYLDYWFGHMPTIIKPVMKLIQVFYQYFAGNGIQKTLKTLGGIFVNLGNILVKLVRPFKDALGGLFNQLSTMKNLGFVDIFKAIIDAIGKAFGGLLEVIKTDFWPTIKAGLVYIWNAISNWVTTTDWVGIWNSIVKGVQAIADYVMNIDWAKVWSLIFTGLTAVWDFFTTYVFPIFGKFFEWLVSWFTDTEKNNQLLSAISTAWNFVVTWAGKFIEWISPYVSGFFNWLLSWFTDPTKNAQLWNAISTVWNFVTLWAGKIWDWVAPPLIAGFSWLFSWFTDPEKRNRMFTGLTNAWVWLTDWAKAIWNWASPYLTAGWNWLKSWFTDPKKNQELKDKLWNGWVFLTDWAKSLWGWISPHLIAMGSSLKTWIDTNYPTFGKWIDEVVKFTTDASKQFKDNFPSMQQAVIDLRNTVVTETPLLAGAFGRLYAALFGGDGSANGNNFANQVSWFFNTITSAIGNMISQARILIEILAIMVEATKAAFSGDFTTYANKSYEFMAKWQEFFATVGNQWDQFTQPTMPVLPPLSLDNASYDSGGSIGASSVGRNAPLDVYIHSDSTLPTDRQSLQAIAEYLSKELNLRGNKVTYAGT